MRVRKVRLRRASWRLPVLVGVTLALLVVAATQGAHVSVAALQTSTPTVFAVIGDYGVDNADETAVKNLVDSWSPSVIATVGDNFYSSAITAGDTGNDYHESVGKYYCAYLAGVAGTSTCPTGTAATNRFFPAMGNHDYSDAQPAPGAFTGYFTLPGTGVATTGSSGNERYYDFIQGPVHFFVLDSNTQEPNGTSSTSVQAQWLQKALAASASTWNIVLFHHPPYSSDNVHGSTTYMQWPYAQWGADAVLSGHAHDYERISRDGIVYFVNGLGAAQTYSFGTPVSGSQVRYTGQHGAQRVTATDTSLTFEMTTIDGVVRDSYTLTKSALAPTATSVPATAMPTATSAPPTVVPTATSVPATAVPTATPVATTPAPTATPAASGASTISFQNGVSPSVSYSGGADAYLSQANAGTNYGGADACLADGDDPPGTGQDLSCLLRWDVSAIPAGSTVTAASITVDVTNSSVSPYPVYQVLQPWHEAEATWQVYASGLPWNVAGALGSLDRGATALGTLDATATGARTFSLNAAGLAVVQSWVNTPSSNQGLIVADSNISDGVDFASDQWGTASQRPKLTVEYVPGSVVEASATPTTVPVIATPTPTALVVASVHAGDLTDASVRTENTWTAGASVLVHDAAHNPVPGVTVSGSWNGALTGVYACVTGVDGRCTLTLPALPASTKSAEFAITGLAGPGMSYDASANHDPDGDSNGTAIVLTR